MPKDTYYLVRHGDYDRDTGELNNGGLEQSRQAGDILLSRVLGMEALILTSTAPQTRQTAEILARRLVALQVVSRRIELGGRYPMGIQDLDEFVDKAGGAFIAGRKLVVVTHAPLIAVAQGQSYRTSSDTVAYGGVFDQEPGSWSNPNYEEFFEIGLEADIARTP